MVEHRFVIVLAMYSLVQFFKGVEAYEECYPHYGGFLICHDNEHCCNNDSECCSTSLSDGAIIGIVFGCLAGFGLLITCMCLCAHNKNHRRRIMVQPNQQAILSCVTYNNQMGYGQTPYGQQAFPNQYGLQQYSNLQHYGQQQYGLTPPSYDTVRATAPPSFGSVHFTHPVPGPVSNAPKH